MASQKATWTRLNRLTEAIGYVCVFWAWLEHTIDEAIHILAPFDPSKMTKSQIDDSQNVFDASGDIRTKIKTLRAIAFIRKWDDKWFQKIDSLLNTIDNDLRVKRNTVVHHHWTAPKGRFQVFSTQARFRRPQAFVRELVTSETKPMRVKDVRRLYAAILRSQIALIRLYMQYQEQQKIIDDEIEKRVAEQNAKLIIKMAALLASSPQKSEQQPLPEVPSKGPPESENSKPSHRRKSSRG